MSSGERKDEAGREVKRQAQPPKDYPRLFAYKRYKEIADEYKFFELEDVKKYPSGSRSYWNERLQSLLVQRNAINQAEQKERVESKIRPMNPQTFNKLLRKGKFQDIINLMVNDKILLTKRQAARFHKRAMNSDQSISFTSKRNNKTLLRPINQTTKSIIINMLNNNFQITDAEAIPGSDTETILVWDQLGNIKIFTPQKPEKPIINTDGGYFNKINSTKIDLSELQIYTTEQVEKLKDREHCIIQALRTGTTNKSISENILNKVKLALIFRTNLTKKQLRDIAKIINKNIILHFYRKTGKAETAEYRYKENKEQDEIHIAIYNNHYFGYYPLNITEFAIKNYDKIHNLENFNKMTEYDSTKQKFRIHNKLKLANSLRVVKLLDDQNKFIVGDMKNFHEAKNEIYLESIETEQQIVSSKKKNLTDDEKEKKMTSIWYADIESFTTKANIQNDEIKKSVEGSENLPSFNRVIDNIHENKISVLEKKNMDSKYMCHQLAMIGVVSDKNDDVIIFNRFRGESDFTQKKAVLAFLNHITDRGKQDAVVYFHNLKYDFSILEGLTLVHSKVVKGTALYGATIKHKKCVVNFKDSAKIISMPLCKIPKNFNLDKKFQKMEAINYEFYNKNTINRRFHINEYLNGLSKVEKKIFLEQVKDDDSFDEDDNTFNPTTYYQSYLELDCLVLKKGMEAFDKSIRELTKNEDNEEGQSVHDSLTISSLTDLYMKNNEAYKDIYEICGNLREYCGQAVFGGRVMANSKHQGKIIYNNLADVDAVSLYPSAIVRLCNDLGGIPTGQAIRFKKSELRTWKSKKFSILTINIVKTNKIRDMPRIPLRSEDGSIKYVNQVDNHKMTISNIGLENMIINHDIEYEVLDGVYWEGVNPQIGELVKKLFVGRLKAKADNKDALQQVIKLMLNSIYGKTLLKKTLKKFKIMSNDIKKKGLSKAETYYYNHQNTIIGMRKMNDSQYEIEEACIDVSFNRAHIGVFILDMSKRIVDEVMNTLDDNNMNCYYSDTDSLHIDYNDVPELARLYEEKYNKKLIGKKLGQFHNDFNLSGVKKYKSEIHTIASCFIGKKTYFDLVKGKTDDGKFVYGSHCRMKGITEAGLKHKALTLEQNNDIIEIVGQKNYSDSDIDKMDLQYLNIYKTLCNGDSLKFTLNPYIAEDEYKKAMFEYTLLGVRLRDECHRIVKMDKK